MKTKSSLIQKFLVLYVIVWTIAPPLQLDMVFRIAVLGAIALWFILNIPYDVHFEKIHILSIVFVLLVVLVTLIETKGNFGDVLKPINMYLLVIAFLMAYSYKDRWNELSDLIPIVLLLLIYFNYQTYVTVVDDPTVARLIVRDDPSTYSYYRIGVGGYGLLYSQVCILPVIIVWIMGALRKSRIKFAIGVVWLITFTLYLLNSGYTIALVVSIVGLVILFLYRRSSIVMAIVVTSIIIVAMVWLIGYNDGFRNALLEFFDGTTVAKKINDIYLSITTAEAADSIMVRIGAYVNSLTTIINFPITGGLWWDNIGGHSAILDVFAKYGIFGGYIYCKIIFDFPMTIKNNPQIGKDIRLANSIFISFFLMFLLNSMPYNLVMMIIFIVPMCYNDILNWRNTDEYSLDSKSSSSRCF